MAKQGVRKRKQVSGGLPLDVTWQEQVWRQFRFICSLLKKVRSLKAMIVIKSGAKLDRTSFRKQRQEPYRPQQSVEFVEPRPRTRQWARRTGFPVREMILCR